MITASIIRVCTPDVNSQKENITGNTRGGPRSPAAGFARVQHIFAHSAKGSVPKTPAFSCIYLHSPALMDERSSTKTQRRRTERPHIGASEKQFTSRRGGFRSTSLKYNVLSGFALLTRVTKRDMILYTDKRQVRGFPQRSLRGGNDKKGRNHGNKTDCILGTDEHVFD